MLARKAVEKVGESAEGHQKVGTTLNQGVETPSGDLRVEENTEKQAQKVDNDTQEVAEILASNMTIEEDDQVEQMEFSTGFDLITDFNNELFQDGQETTQHVQETAEA
jgi:hypothetical protein